MTARLSIFMFGALLIAICKPLYAYAHNRDQVRSVPEPNLLYGPPAGLVQLSPRQSEEVKVKDKLLYRHGRDGLRIDIPPTGYKYLVT